MPDFLKIRLTRSDSSLSISIHNPMKIPNTSSSRKGFTLIELLVVIAIIAVLAAAGFAGGNAAMQKARKVTAQAAATSVATAIDQFYTEYSSLPDVSGSPMRTDGGDGVKLLNILAGLETGTDIENDRKVRFLSLKEAKNGNRDGVVFDGSGSAITGLYDPWGEPYYIVIDDDYDEKLTVTPGGSIQQAKLNGRRAAVYSLGVKNSGDASSSTLVKTW